MSKKPLSSFSLSERDLLILREVSRWKFLLGRQIRMLASFSGERSCDRRLKKLIDNEFLERKYILFGVPGLYFLGKNSKSLGAIKYYSFKTKLDEIHHDIAVVDTFIFLIQTEQLSLDDITSERQLHSLDGFSNRKHQPDGVFIKDGKRFCVEVEFTPKNKTRFVKNIRDNFNHYDGQIWVVPKDAHQIRRMINEVNYPDSLIIDWEVVEKHARKK